MFISVGSTDVEAAATLFGLGLMGASVMVLILTALGGKEDRDKAKALGADAYLEKSTVDLEAILAKVNELLALS